jgi:hypothetical protein
VSITPVKSEIDRLFGREADLTRLLQRMERYGLTAVVGPPKSAKVGC